MVSAILQTQNLIAWVSFLSSLFFFFSWFAFIAKPLFANHQFVLTERKATKKKRNSGPARKAASKKRRKAKRQSAATSVAAQAVEQLVDSPSKAAQHLPAAQSTPALIQQRDCTAKEPVQGLPAVSLIPTALTQLPAVLGITPLPDLPTLVRKPLPIISNILRPLSVAANRPGRHSNWPTLPPIQLPAPSRPSKAVSRTTAVSASTYKEHRARKIAARRIIRRPVPLLKDTNPEKWKKECARRQAEREKRHRKGTELRREKPLEAIKIGSEKKTIPVAESSRPPRGPRTPPLEEDILLASPVSRYSYKQVPSEEGILDLSPGSDSLMIDLYADVNTLEEKKS